jgi:hypothetical protein
MAPKAVSAVAAPRPEPSLSRAWPAPTIPGASTCRGRSDGLCRRGPWPRKRWMHGGASTGTVAFAGMARSYKVKAHSDQHIPRGDRRPPWLQCPRAGRRAPCVRNRTDTGCPGRRESGLPHGRHSAGEPRVRNHRHRPAHPVAARPRDVDDAGRRHPHAVRRRHHVDRAGIRRRTPDLRDDAASALHRFTGADAVTVGWPRGHPSDVGVARTQGKRVLSSATPAHKPRIESAPVPELRCCSCPLHRNAPIGKPTGEELELAEELDAAMAWVQKRIRERGRRAAARPTPDVLSVDESSGGRIAWVEQWLDAAMAR